MCVVVAQIGRAIGGDSMVMAMARSSPAMTQNAVAVTWKRRRSHVENGLVKALGHEHVADADGADRLGVARVVLDLPRNRVMRESMAQSKASASRWLVTSSSQSRTSRRFEFSTNSFSRLNSPGASRSSIPSLSSSSRRSSPARGALPLPAVRKSRRQPHSRPPQNSTTRASNFVRPARTADICRPRRPPDRRPDQWYRLIPKL